MSTDDTERCLRQTTLLIGLTDDLVTVRILHTECNPPPPHTHTPRASGAAHRTAEVGTRLPCCIWDLNVVRKYSREISVGLGFRSLTLDQWYSQATMSAPLRQSSVLTGAGSDQYVSEVDSKDVYLLRSHSMHGLPPPPPSSSRSAHPTLALTQFFHVVMQIVMPPAGVLGDQRMLQILVEPLQSLGQQGDGFDWATAEAALQCIKCVPSEV